MTAGNLKIIQVNNTPSMNYYIGTSGNPQMSYFKSVYRKHSNFSFSYINVQPTNSVNLEKNTDTEVKFKIPRNSDLINEMYFSFELPDIYSRNNLKFRWIRRLAEYVVKDITFRVGSNQIDKQYSEFFQIWAELNQNNEQKTAYDKLIGNTTDMFDPESVTGHTSYPGSSTSTALAYPSIVGRRIYLPLRFYFNGNSSLALPLIALQYDEIFIDITLRQINELYIILNSGLVAAPSTSAHDIGNFLLTTTTQTSLSIDPRLEIKSIYLDNEERKNVSLNTAEYLGYQVKRLTSNGNTTNEISVDLKDINKPVKQIFFMARRTDFENLNLWSNFTNWYLKDVPIYGQNHDTTYPNMPITLSTSNVKYYQTQSLLKAAELKLDLHSLTIGDPTDYTGASQSLEGKESTFFNLLQNYTGNKGIPDEGIYNINFNIDSGNSIQPNGVCNMSSINKKELKLYLNEVHTDSSFSFNYNVLVFAINYEIMKFMGGSMGTAYSN